MESESGSEVGNTLSHQAVAKWLDWDWDWERERDFWPEWQVASKCVSNCC